ncbi:MAG: hypothetical protein WDN45_15790 [Caulobacteraceae bacterium]
MTAVGLLAAKRGGAGPDRLALRLRRRHAGRLRPGPGQPRRLPRRARRPGVGDRPGRPGRLVHRDAAGGRAGADRPVRPVPRLCPWLGASPSASPCRPSRCTGWAWRSASAPCGCAGRCCCGCWAAGVALGGVALALAG